MAEGKSERTYSDEEIQQRLKRDLPHWYLETVGYAASIAPTAGKVR